ncbi:serine hydrolase domain-containing protein [Streptomyces capparidis]
MTAVTSVLVLVAWFAVGCGSGGGGRGAIEEFLDGELPRGSSGTLIAARGGELEVCRGWGASDREGDVDAGCDTVYDIGSVTKQFTAAAVVKLQAQGRLRTSDTIGEHLRGVPGDKRGITVGHLLTHTSGLLDSLGDDYEPLSRAEFLDEALASDLLAAPGEEYRYSNVGYSLLAAIVEEVSGEDYESYLAEHLFRPAGMRLTGYVLPDWDDGEIAVEYSAAGDPRGTPLDHPWADDGPYWNLRGNGGMLSTARDMYRWHLALDGDRVLDPAAKRELFEPRVREAPDETYYAYGWVVTAPDGSGILWHNGGNDLSYAEIAREPNGSGFVFWVTNRVRSTAGDWDFEETGAGITEGVMERLHDSR